MLHPSMLFGLIMPGLCGLALAYECLLSDKHKESLWKCVAKVWARLKYDLKRL